MKFKNTCALLYENGYAEYLDTISNAMFMKYLALFMYIATTLHSAKTINHFTDTYIKIFPESSDQYRISFLNPELLEYIIQTNINSSLSCDLMIQCGIINSNLDETKLLLVFSKCISELGTMSNSEKPLYINSKFSKLIKFLRFNGVNLIIDPPKLVSLQGDSNDNNNN